MESRRIRHIGIIALVMIAMMGVVSSQAFLLAHSARAQEPEREWSGVLKDCQATAVEGVPGDRPLDPERGESAISMPPLVELEKCEDNLVFFRTLVMLDGDVPMEGRFPEGRIGVTMFNGSMILTVSSGQGYVLNCSEDLTVPCTRTNIEEANPEIQFPILKGDSFFLQDISDSAPLTFTLAFDSAEEFTAGAGRLLLAPGNGAKAGVGGSTTGGGGFSPMGCDGSKCY